MPARGGGGGGEGVVIGGRDTLHRISTTFASFWGIMPTALMGG